MIRFFLAFVLTFFWLGNVIAQEATPQQSAINSLQARIMAVRAQREDAMDQLAAAKADLSLAQEEIKNLREAMAKLTPKPADKPSE